MKFEFEGMDQLLSELERADRSVQSSKSEALIAGAKVMQKETKNRAPVRAIGGGNLKAHIEISEIEDGEVLVYVDQQGKAYYGYFHEVGTSKMRARPFMGPAYISSRNKIERAIAQKISERLRLL